MATIVTPEEDTLSPVSEDAPGPPAKLSSSDELSSNKNGSGVVGCGGESNHDVREPEVNGGRDGVALSEEIIRVQVGAVTKKLQNVVVVDDDDDVPANCDLVEENLYLGELDFLYALIFTFLPSLFICPSDNNSTRHCQILTQI